MILMWQHGKTAKNFELSHNFELTVFELTMPVYLFTKNALSAQDRSPFCIFHIVNEILQHPEFMDTFLVGNHYHIF